VVAEADGRGDQFGKGRNIGVGRCAGPTEDQRRELVPTEPGHQVVVGVAGQPVGDGDQDVVSGGVPVAVVDVLEVVQVEQEDDGRATGRVGEQGGAPVEEGASVGQVGERVVVGGVAVDAQFVAESGDLPVGAAGVEVTTPTEAGAHQTQGTDGEGERIQHFDHPELMFVNRQYIPAAS